MSKLFGGKDPFHDPFFRSPFFGYPFDYDNQAAPRTEISIQEIDTQNHSVPTKEEVFNYPNDNSYGTPSFSFKRVSYGGVNGMYYSSSMGTRTGGDGVVLVEIKEEDKTVGQSLSTISKGISDKGHSVTTKHNPDGTVNSIQTLHNLYEDELAGFEETWKVNADQHLPGWNNGFNFLEDSVYQFYIRTESFRNDDARENRYNMEPIAWWFLYGSGGPMLQKITLKILLQPSSSSCAERNWSTYSFVNSSRRNRLTPKRSKDLVFIHNNLWLLSRRKDKYKMGAIKMWDSTGDELDTIEDVGEFQIASLSLDEPELETMVFGDEAEGVRGLQAVNDNYMDS